MGERKALIRKLNMMGWDDVADDDFVDSSIREALIRGAYFKPEVKANSQPPEHSASVHTPYTLLGTLMLNSTHPPEQIFTDGF